MVSPPHTWQPATDGQCVSPSSRFLTLNWSSWSVRSETTGESSLGDPGPGDEATRDWSGRAMRERRKENKLGRESVYIRVCVRPIICVSSAFCEGTRWGLFTPLWVLEAPCSHFLLSFVTNQVPFSPSYPPAFLFSSPPFLLPCLHLWQPVCTVDFFSFTTDLSITFLAAWYAAEDRNLWLYATQSEIVFLGPSSGHDVKFRHKAQQARGLLDWAVFALLNWCPAFKWEGSVYNTGEAVVVRGRQVSKMYIGNWTSRPNITTLLS